MSSIAERNKHANDLIRYLPNGDVQIRLDNILTRNKIVHKNMLLLKVEGRHVDVIKVRNVWDEDGIVHLKVQDNETGKDYTISHVLDPNVKYFVWWIVSYDYVTNTLGDRSYEKLINEEGLLEFDY